MTPKTAFWKWSAIGGITTAVLIIAQVNAVGGVAGLLQVGVESDARPLIESELGEIPLAPFNGHDGQISYVIGLDLLGDDVPDLLDHGAYRYRRIAYPAVASAFGLLGGEALLVGMIVVTIVMAGLASGLTAAMAVRFQKSDWLALAVLLNPGVWLSVRLLTSDTMALGTMVLGLFWMVEGRRGAAAASFALSGLAKDAYIVNPGGLAISREPSRWIQLLVSVAALGAWGLWLSVSMGDAFTGRGNFALPFAGIIDASSVWPAFGTAELVYLAFALASVFAGLFYSLFVKSWLRWPILAWSVLGVISSNWVWDLGNNAARVFAPIVVLMALAEARRRSASQAARVMGEPQPAPDAEMS